MKLNRKSNKIKERPRSVLEILGNDPRRWWYPIDDRLRGYEISNDGYIRSCKILKNGYGCIIRPNKYGLYNLVDENGQRGVYTLAFLRNLAEDNEFSPRKTEFIESAARNKRIFQKKEHYVKNVGWEQEIPTMFTVIPDPPTEKAKFTIVTRNITCPIYDITGGGVYYGRTEEDEE